MDNERKEFARKLQNLMLKKGWNQSELARQARLGRDNISGYMRGKNIPNSGHLHKLAEALGVSPGFLYKGVLLDAVEDEFSFEVRVLKNDPSKSLVRISQVMPSIVAAKITAIIMEYQGSKK